MPRQVSFLVKCADTRVGLHVRVVGSVAALGEWDPHKGLVLNTSASDFPNWKQTEPTPLEEGNVVEYKYVICDNNGDGVRWEERANRCVHIADLVQREMVPPNGMIAITENFVAYDSDEMRFRLGRGGLDRVRSSSSRLQSRQGSTILPEHSGGYGGAMINSASLSDLLAPTIRERKPSKMGLDVMGGYRRDSAVNLGDIKPEGDVPECVEPHDPTPHNSSIAGDTGMVREESCSNLFDEIIQPEETQPDKSEFEDKYALVGNGPLGEGTFGLVWRCTPKSAKVIREDKEMAAKIVRKARLQPRDMKYLLGDDGEVKLHLTMKHDHICELLEYFDEPSTVTLILEYCRGGDLFDSIVAQSKLTGRGFTEMQAIIATRHVLSALQYLHKQKVVHRDIKCENILLKHDGIKVEDNIFKLCDFGFAAHDSGQGLTDRLGSPDTVAPEIVVGTKYSTPVDMWSAGVLVYMMLSATPPFYAPTDNEVLRKVKTGSYNLSGEPWDSLPRGPKDLIASLMTVDANKRPSATEALNCVWLQK